MELKTKEPFQEWHNNSSVDEEIKTCVIKKTYYRFFSVDLAKAELYHIPYPEVRVCRTGREACRRCMADSIAPSCLLFKDAMTQI